MDHKKRFKATEILFTPGLLEQQKHDKCGLAEMAFNSIELCDSDLRQELYNNIVLAGGSSVMLGFKERFETEIIRKGEDRAKCDIYVNAAQCE